MVNITDCGDEYDNDEEDGDDDVKPPDDSIPAVTCLAWVQRHKQGKQNKEHSGDKD